MTTFTRAALQSLLGEVGAPCVSITMPIHPGRPEAQQDPIRLRNLCKQARAQVAEIGADADTVMAPLEQVAGENITGASNEDAGWSQKGNGLALFASPLRHELYRIPDEQPELAIVGDSFHTRPLVSLLRGGQDFHLLTLSRQHVRLYHGSATHLQPAEDSGLPDGLREALGVEQRQRTIGQHRGPSGQVIMHGQGAAETDRRNEVVRYLRTVDRALRAHLRLERAPLVVAGVEEMLSVFQRVCRYPFLLEHGVRGNVDRDPVEVLHQKAWEVVRPGLAERRRETIGAYVQASAGGRATDDLGRIGRAAALGRVRTLLFRDGEVLWGAYDRTTGQIDVRPAQEHEGDVDVIDDLAEQVLRCDGDVEPLRGDEMPSGNPVAAVLRW